MLRVILAALGVALIAFGLFGGKSLEQVYAGLTSAFEKFSGGAQEVVADTTSIDSGSQQSASESVIALNNTESDAVTDSAVREPAAIAEQQNQQTDTAVAVTAADSERELNIANMQSGDDASEVRVASEARVASSAELDSVDIDSGAEKVAGKVTAASADGSSAVKEVKASARNEELEMALGTTGSEESERPKEADVGEILQTTTGGTENVDALFVLKDLVNMRRGPSIEHPVVLRLEKGQELMEFKRDGKWVHVGAYGTSGKIGWVHERLVGKTPE